MPQQERASGLANGPTRGLCRTPGSPPAYARPDETADATYDTRHGALFSNDAARYDLPTVRYGTVLYDCTGHAERQRRSSRAGAAPQLRDEMPPRRRVEPRHEAQVGPGALLFIALPLRPDPVVDCNPTSS